MKRISYLFLFSLIVLSLSCHNEPTGTETGTIYISVTDETDSPVPNKEIIITPDSMVKKTDKNGICKFELEPGEYFVNTHVSRPGPAGYYYHKTITVKSNKTVKVEISTCLMCF